MNLNDLAIYERLVVVMQDWAEWVRGYRINNGFPSRSIGIESGYGSSKSFDDMIDDVENEMCRLIDTAVDDLTDTQRAAINRCYGLANVMRFRRGSDETKTYEQLVVEAHETLLVTLPKKGVVF